MDLTIITVKLIELCGKFQDVVATLLGGYLGYKLSWRVQKRERALERLSKEIEAFQQIKIEFENSLPALSGEQLKNEIEKQDGAKKYGCIRLLGLRNELIPHIDPALKRLIDNGLIPLYDRSKRGDANLIPEKMDEFVRFVDIFRKEIVRLEEKYQNEYERLIN